MAHGILLDEIEKRNLSWEVDSSGTSAFHSGEAPDRRAIETARINGIDISNQKSRQLTTQDLSTYDLIITMDTNNYNNALKLTQSKQEKSKVKMLLNYSFPNENRAVPDPYYSGGFDYVYDMIRKAVQDMIGSLTQDN